MDFFRCAAARVVAVEVTAHSLGDGGFTRLVQALPRLSLTLSLSLPLSLSHPLSLHAARAGAAPAVSPSFSLSSLFLFSRLVQALPRLRALHSLVLRDDDVGATGVCRNPPQRAMPLR
jgi:hypothetical protein